VAVARRRRARRLLRLLRFTALALPGLAVFACDAWKRAPHLLGALDRIHTIGYLGSSVASACIWGSLLYVAAWRRSPLRHVAGALFVALYGLSTAVGSAFFAMYGVYCGVDSQIDAESIAWAPVCTLPIERPRVLLHFVVAFVTAVSMLLLARAVVRPRRVPKLARPIFLAAPIAALLYIPASYHTLQSSPPDLIFVHGLVDVVGRHVTPPYVPLVHASRRRPAALPGLEAKPARPRDVLFILQESERFDVTCVDPKAPCTEATRESHAAMPGRLPFLAMRSNASSTHVSMQVLWTGLTPIASKDAMETAPMLWDYARAAGYDVAYWTSQNLVFGNERLAMDHVSFSHTVSGTELDPMADMVSGARDRRLAERVVAEIDELREPFYAVVQLANIHRPRVFDAADAPFEPTDPVEYSGKNERQRNYYRNVVHLSDRAVARVVRHVRERPFGARTVVVFTSDHGESWFEHKQDNDHAGSVFDEELRVPAWIDAPPGTLDEAEEKSLEEKRDAAVFHLDVAPTVLDLFGLWDSPAIAAFRAAMPGHPLTRPELTTEPVVLSNVTWVWEYLVPNYGLMHGSLKVEALERDARWLCFDVAKDPTEEHELGLADPRCKALAAQADSRFHVLPKDLGRLRTNGAFAR
jgi:hypothetical protein